MSEQRATPLAKGWRMARVGDILKVRNGYAFKSTEYKPHGVPLIRQSDLGDDVVDVDAAKRVDPRLLDDLPGFVVRDGDLLIGMSGSLGKIARYQHVEPALQNQRTGLLLVKPEYDKKFAKLVLKFVEPQILAEGKGVAVQNVSAKEIEDCTFPLPSFTEQREIVAEIEKQFTRLDAGIAALRRVQAHLKRYHAAVLKAACEARLVPTEAELAKAENRKFETGEKLLARILEERRKSWEGRGKYKEPIAPDTYDSVPAGWTLATVGQLAAPEANSITDGPFGSNLKTEHYTATGPRVIRLQNIGDGVFIDEYAHISEEHFSRLQKHRVFAGDVVIASLGENPPRCCVIPELLGLAIVKADCIRFKPHSLVLSKFINIALNSDPVRRRTKKIVHGVGRPRLNLGEIKSIALPVPPLAEQTRIVAEVERRLSVVEELETFVTVNLQRAARLRQSILASAFSD